jgi:uncharacterized protein (TIRG00374 family)
MKRRNGVFAAVGIAISVVFLWIAFRNLHPAQVWASIQQADSALLLIGAVWFFAPVIVMGLRWQYLMNAVCRVPLRQLVMLVCIGYAGNNVYPFRSGEVLRILLLHRSYRVAYARSTTIILVERVFDGLVMLTFVLIALLLTDISSPETRMVAGVAAPVFLTALAVFLLLAARPNLLRRFVRVFSRLLPGRLQTFVSGLTEDVISGLSGLRSPADLAGAVVTSYLAWGLKATVHLIVAWAFNLETNFLIMLLVVGVVNLAGLVPASPGQFGVFETLASVILVATGVPELQALAFAVTIHMVIWLPVTLVGLYFLLRQGLGLSAITQPEQIERQTTA